MSERSYHRTTSRSLGKERSRYTNMITVNVSHTTWVMPFSGFSGYPRDTTQHLPAPIWATLGPLIQKHDVAPLFILPNPPNCAKFPSLKCAHISFWLNPTGHSKFHNTLNHPPPATDLGRTACTPLYPPLQPPPPINPSPLLFLSRTEELAKARYLCPWQCVRYNCLLSNPPIRPDPSVSQCWRYLLFVSAKYNSFVLANGFIT